MAGQFNQNVDGQMDKESDRWTDRRMNIAHCKPEFHCNPISLLANTVS